MVLNANGFIMFLFERSISGTPFNPYSLWLLEFLPGWLVAVPVSVVNLVSVSIASVGLIHCHLKLPKWRRIPLPGASLGTQANPHKIDLSSSQSKIQKKAERCIEKGKLLKAARYFDQLGQEFFYRAGKLYHQRGREKEAADSFLRRQFLYQSGAISSGRGMLISTETTGKKR